MLEAYYKDVFEYEKVKKHLTKNSNDKAKVIKFVDEIRGDYRPSVVGTATKIIDKTFLRLYDGVNLDIPDDFNVEELQKKYHLILVPNHQSHADYIALQYVFYRWYKAAVYIAAGINLNIFPVGQLFKRCGAFFIRRRFDDELYKIVFQGYIYHLLKRDKIVEFFFEGGRTRTGKLLSPKFGLFSMLLDAHEKFGKDKRPLMFIPVAIAHEMIPEEKSHAKELSGAKKQKEKSTQLFKLFKLFGRKFGTIHVSFGEGIIIDQIAPNLKKATQELAFDCFRAVGSRMPITPSSILALLLLDNSGGAMTWSQIEESAKEIIDYCKRLKIPFTKSLQSQQRNASLKVAMDMFINNKKVDLIKQEKLNQVYYTINENSRVHLLYNKNMILHHFIVPNIMNATLFNIFSGKIQNSTTLTRFLITKRKELKYEFYLPKVKEMINEAIEVIEYCIDERPKSLSDALDFKNEKLYEIARKISKFSTGFSYIYEAYYISAIGLRFLSEESFSEDKFLQISKELFEMEFQHGRVVKCPESYNTEIIKNSLKFFIQSKVIGLNEDKTYKVIDREKVGSLSEKFAKDVNDQLALNLRFT